MIQRQELRTRYFLNSDFEDYTFYPFTKEDINDLENHSVAFDFFYNDEWDLSKSRPLVIINPGSGVSDHYGTNSALVQELIQQDIIPCVCYYVQDGLITSKGNPFYGGWGFIKFNIEIYSLRNMIYLTSVLRFISEDYDEIIPLIDKSKIILHGKSRGAGMLNDFNHRNAAVAQAGHAKYVPSDLTILAVWNANGVTGSQPLTEGWLDFSGMIRNLSRCMIHSRWPQINVYNDLDPRGAYTVRETLRSLVTFTNSKNHFFVNHWDLAHEEDFHFDATVMKAIFDNNGVFEGMIGQRSYGENVTLFSEGYFRSYSTDNTSSTALKSYESSVDWDMPNIRKSVFTGNITEKDDTFDNIFPQDENSIYS